MGVSPSIPLNSGYDAEPNRSEKKDPLLHKLDEIMKLNSTTTDGKAPQKDDARSPQGIFLDKKNMKYWVDGQNNNCFMIYPRGLSITWGEDGRYWSWEDIKDEESGDRTVEIARLVNVCWLEIHGKLELSYLNPDVTYEVFFEVRLNEDADGWGTPVDLRLKLPQGRVQESQENLDKKPKNMWLLLKVRDIQTERGQNGDDAIFLFQYGTHWKEGLVIKGIVVTPKQ